MNKEKETSFCSINALPMESGNGCGRSSVKHRRRVAFTLIEMLVATVLSAVLISAVLLMLAGVSRDRKTLSRLNATHPNVGIIDLIRWDLSNARTVTQRGNGLLVTGLNGIEPGSLTPNGRLVQVQYEVESGNLWRVQEYLDEPARPGLWHELIATDVSNFQVGPISDPASPIRLRMNCTRGVIDQKLWIR